MIDWATFTNWVITGLLGVVFGTASAWVTYRYNRERDNLRWERDRLSRDSDWRRQQDALQQQWEHEQLVLKQQWEQEGEKQQQQWIHDRELLTAQFEQRLVELREQIVRQEKVHLRDEILKGTDDPKRWIESWEHMRQQLERFECERMEMEARRLKESAAREQEYLRNSERALSLIEEESRALSSQAQRELYLANQIRKNSVLMFAPSPLFWVLIGVAVLLVANLIAILIVREWGFSLVLILVAIGLVGLTVKVIRDL